VFTREGWICTACCRYRDGAALGTTVRLPTLTEGEELELDIEPGTQTGTVRTLRGKGLPRLRSTGRVDGWGDLMVHIEVATRPARRAADRAAPGAGRPARREQPEVAMSGRTAAVCSPGCGVPEAPAEHSAAVPARRAARRRGGRAHRAEGHHAATVRRIPGGGDGQLGDGRGSRATGSVVTVGRDTLAGADPGPRAGFPGHGPRSPWSRPW